MFAVTLTSGDTIYLVPENVLSVRSDGSGSAISYKDRSVVYSVQESASVVNTLIESATAATSNGTTKNEENSTTTPLDAGNTWTGTSTNPCSQPAIMFTVETDQDGEITLQVSQDNTNFTTIATYQYRAGTTTNRPHVFQMAARYYKVAFENTSASNQTYLRISTYEGVFGGLNVPFNGTIARDADTVVTVPIDFALPLAQGKVDGYKNFDKFGYNRDLDTGDGAMAIWSAKVAFVPQTTADIFEVFSSSASDTSAGAGARTVTITGLDGTGLEQTETVTLNGTTAVTTTNAFKGVNRASVATAGSTGYNVGNITIRQTTGSVVQGYIPANSSVTEQLIFHIPSDKKAYIKRLELDVSKPSGGGNPKVTIVGYNIKNGVRYNIFQTVINTATNLRLNEMFTNYIELDEGVWYLTAETDSNNTLVRARVEQTLVDKLQ